MAVLNTVGLFYY